MPREVRYCRPKSQPAETLLSYLSHKFTYLSRDAWTNHLSAGHVFVNGAVLVTGDYVLQQGDMLRFAPPRSLEPCVDEENIRVLYEDAAFLVCAKNGNLPVAEGGRYCENTLIGVLQRRGSGAFYTADTVVVGGAASRGDENAMLSEKYVSVVDAAVLSKEELSNRQNNISVERKTDLSQPGKRLRTLTPPREADTALAPPPNTALTTACPTLLTVQRLDKETSGVLVLCKSSGAAKKLANQLESQTRRCSAAVEARVATSQAPFLNSDFDQILQQGEKTVCKTYMAVLLGAAPIGETFVVVNYMGTMQSCPAYSKDPAHSRLSKLKMCCEPLSSSSGSPTISQGDTLRGSQWGKVACTRVRVLTSSEVLGLSCVQVELLTGRSHQIRVHCASLGYPVLGDKLYTCVSRGEAKGCVAVTDATYLERVRSEEASFLLVENGAAEGQRMWCRRHLLHATELQFRHPEKCPAEVMSFVASPVDVFTRDVRFESSQDAHSFQVMLKDAFERYTKGKCNSV